MSAKSRVCAVAAEFLWLVKSLKPAAVLRALRGLQCRGILPRGKSLPLEGKVAWRKP
jgi:hypothetical protein